MKPYLLAIGLPLLLLLPGQGKKKVIATSQAPQAIGPYSQAIEIDGTLYVSGQIALRTDGTLDTTSFENECERVLANISSILAAAGKQNEDVCKSTVYLTNLQQYTVFNKIYASFFKSEFPAREVVQVTALPKGAHVEMSVIAR